MGENLGINQIMGLYGQESDTKSGEDKIHHHHELHEHTVHGKLCRTKETSVKFIISRYHNGKFYFNQQVEISGEFIYKLNGLSIQGDPVPIGIK